MSIACVTDADLVARALEGDTSAFGELVDRHRSAVFRAAFAALGSYAEADDATQDACVLAFQRLRTFRGTASFKTWLITIAWRQAINRRRSLSRWLKRTVASVATDDRPDGALLDMVSPEESPEQQSKYLELRQAIAQEIRRLSARLRDALLLSQSGDYTYEQIAAMLDAPTGTVKWRVAEARRIVKARLKSRGFTDVG